jgi:hypothetical protein
MKKTPLFDIIDAAIGCFILSGALVLGLWLTP